MINKSGSKFHALSGDNLDESHKTTNEAPRPSGLRGGCRTRARNPPRDAAGNHPALAKELLFTAQLCARALRAPADGDQPWAPFALPARTTPARRFAAPLAARTR